MSYIQKGTASYRKALFALFSGSFVTFSLLYSAQPLIPIFSSEFGVSPTNASLSLSFSTGVLAIVMLFTPSLSNSIGRKQIMSIALLVASILSILTAITPNFSLLLLSRALLGAVLAGFPSIAMTYISEEFHPKELGTVMGIYISGNTVGGFPEELLLVPSRIGSLGKSPSSSLEVSHYLLAYGFGGIYPKNDIS